MLLTRFRHKGLKQLHADDNAKGVPSAMADKLRKLLFSLETATDPEQVNREDANTASDIDLIDYH